MKVTSGNEKVRDILENDVYDDSMSHGYRSLYPEAWGWMEFNDRDDTVYPSGYAGLLNEQFQDLRKVGSDPAKMDFFSNAWNFIPQRYFDWRQSFRFNPEYITFWQDDQDHLRGKIIAPMAEVGFYESPLLTVNSQTFNEINDWHPDDNWEDVLRESIDNMNEAGLKVAEFGFRRRAYNWMHDRVNQILFEYGGSFKNGGLYTGPSTPYHAYFNGLAPKGTVAHQWPMFHAAVFGIEWANQTATAAWRAVYGTNVATALPDTFTDAFFWTTLTREMAHLIPSYRFDSGNAIQQINLANRYFTNRSIEVDPSSKTLMPTDSLDDHTAIKLSRHIRSLGYQDAFGIGGHFTNNKNYFKKTPAYRPLRTVIKLIAVSLDHRLSWLKTAKLSNTPGKYTGSENTIEDYLAYISKHPFPY